MPGEAEFGDLYALFKLHKIVWGNSQTELSVLRPLNGLQGNEVDLTCSKVWVKGKFGRMAALGAICTKQDVSGGKPCWVAVELFFSF